MPNLAKEIIAALRERVLSEGRTVKTQVAMLVIYPTGYQYFNQKRFGFVAPEESAQQIDKVANAWAKKLHLALTDPNIARIRSQHTKGVSQEHIQAQVNEYIEGIDWETIQVGGDLTGSGLTRGALLELYNMRSNKLPPVIQEIADKYNSELMSRWEQIIDQYQGLDVMERQIERAYAARDRAGDDEDDKSQLMDPKELGELEAQFLELRGQYTDEVSQLKQEIYDQPLNDEELEAIRDEYWELLQKVGRSHAQRSLENIKFKEVGVRLEDVYQVAQVTITSLFKQYRGKVPIYVLRRMLEASTQPTVGTSPLGDYSSYLLKRPQNREALARLIVEYEQQYGVDADRTILNDRDLLRAFRAGLGRDSVYQQLATYNIKIDPNNPKQFEAIEDAIESTIDELADIHLDLGELDDTTAEREAEKDLQARQQADIAYQDYEEEEEEEDQEPPPELFEAEEKYQYIPLPNDPDETWRPPVDLTKAGRQPGDIRPALSDHTMFGPGKGNVLLLIGYGHEEKGKWIGFEPLGGRGGTRRLSGRNDPFHAVLEWLWVSLLSEGKSVDPYDGFMRNRLPPGKETTNPYLMPIKGYSPQQGYDPRYGQQVLEEPTENIIPVPVALNYQSVSYHLTFRIGTNEKNSFGGNPIAIRENFTQFLHEHEQELIRRRISFEIQELSEDLDFPYTIVYFYAIRDIQTVQPIQGAQPEDEVPVASDEMRKRIRLARSINATKVENVANRIKINPRIYSYRDSKGVLRTYNPIALWYAIGGGKIGSGNETKRYHLEELISPQQREALNRRVEKNSITQRKTAVRPNDYQFPLELIRLTIDDLQKIYWKQENPKTRELIQKEINVLEGVLNDAAQTDTQRRIGYRTRRAKKAAEHAATLESRKLEKEREKNFQAAENAVIAARTWGGTQVDESIMTGHEIFRMVRDIIQQCGRLLQRNTWDDTFKYRSLLNTKAIFENLLAISLDPEFTGADSDEFRNMVRDTVAQFKFIELPGTSTGEETIDPVVQALRTADLSNLLNYRTNLDGSLWVHPDEYNIKLDALIVLHHIIRRIHDTLESLLEEYDPRTSPEPRMFARQLFSYKNIGGE